MTKEQRADLHEEIAALREEFRVALAGVRERLDALERPKVAKVVFDPSKPESGGATQR
jgi:hypothetical protein